MEQAQNRNSTKDHVQRHRKSKTKHSPGVANENNNPAALRQLKCQLEPCPLLSGNDKKDSVLHISEEGGIVKKVEIEEKMLKKKLKALPEIPGLNLEKSAKDLQRCSVSISRYREMVKEEVEMSVRNIKSTFAELYKSLIDREAQLMLEAEKLKCEALETLLAREQKAEELRRFTEFSSQRTDVQMVELRSQIKNLVSDRKYDEELLKTARITYDAEELKRQILTCGEISHPKNSYSVREVCNQVMSYEADSITDTSPKTQWKLMQKPPRNSKSCAESTKIATVISKEPLDSDSPSACSTKQVIYGVIKIVIDCFKVRLIYLLENIRGLHRLHLHFLDGLVKCHYA
ncbi:hypothetical protein XENTR_v10024376 [Xenopus tropicalis]|nr:hypothetical protein XENTR_v10024376 [Xenopus tropicalis]KAE8580262.1 hypothetical protein XENTR_v10024376 [Xenopus tropicalis]